MPTPNYLSLSTEKTTECRRLFEFAGRIAVLLESPRVQSSAAMQATLDDLLGAVYTMVLARNQGYDDRLHALDAKDVQAVSVRARDMSEGKVRTDGKWTAGFYFNNALFRISAALHRALKIVTGNENKRLYVDGLLPSAQALFPHWLKANLMKIHEQVNDLKHTPDGIYGGRDVRFDEGVSALVELMNLIEAWEHRDGGRIQPQ
jgi:hypothetical protein